MDGNHLTEITGSAVLGVYAEKADSRDAFIAKRGYDKLVAGKNVLVVDDVLTTGGLTKKVVEATCATVATLSGSASSAIVVASHRKI